MKALEGLGVALVTPFNQEYEVDYKALTNILDNLYTSDSVDYLVVLGSTGEAATLSAEEKQEILSFVNEYNNSRLPLVFGHGGNDTKALIQALYTIDFTGYSAILSASPAYVKPTQVGIISHYHNLADNSPLPIILYNIPSRTSSNISATSIKVLSEHKNIIGVKEASGDLLQAMEIKAVTDNDFLLISGDDMLTVPLCSIGAVGLISVMANAYPTVFSKILSLCSSKDFSGATKEALTTIRLNDLMYDEGNPVGIKELMAQMGLCESFVRLPLIKASTSLSEHIQHNLL